MKRSLFLAASVLLLTFGNVPAEAAPTSIPKDVPYSDENTGVVFPPALGAFRKTEIRINSNPVVGTRIQYSGERLGCTADIFIYSLGERPEQITPSEFLRHYNQLRAGILNLQNLSRKIEEVESAGQWKVSGGRNGTIWRELFYIRTDGEETYHSELVLILCGDRIVKLRVAVPASQKDAVEEAKLFVSGFIQLFTGGKTPAFLPHQPSGRSGRAQS